MFSPWYISKENYDFALNSNRSIINYFQEKVSSSLWSYGSWLCNQCLSPLKLSARIPLMARCIRYNIMWSVCQLLCCRSVVSSGYSSFLHQWNWPPRHNWNIVESGVKHHKPNPYPSNSIIFLNKYKYVLRRTSENYTVIVYKRMPCTWNPCCFLISTDKILTITHITSSTKCTDRQAITMANHIFTSKQTHYVYCTSQHWLFWIYLFCFYHMLKAFEIWYA